MIDWKKTPITEPAITATMPTDEVRACMNSPLELPAWPCHGQSIERTLKKVNEASLQVAGFEMRDGWIRAADDSRKRQRWMETKKDYKLLLLGT